MKKTYKIKRMQDVDISNFEELEDVPEFIDEVVEEPKKKKFPLKKTLLIAGGTLAGLFVGALLLSGKKTEEPNSKEEDSNGNDSDSEDEILKDVDRYLEENGFENITKF